MQHPPPAEGPEYERADALVSFFQPFRWRTQLGQLLALGLLAAVARPSWRPALIVLIAAGAVVLASAALDGNVWRYRYPVDPLLAVTVGGGAQALWLAGVWIARRLTTAAGGRRPAAAAEARRPEPAAIVERGA